MSRIADGFRLGDGRGLSIFRRWRGRDFSRGQHFFDEWDQPPQQAAGAKYISAGNAHFAVRWCRVALGYLEGNRNYSFELEDVRYIVNEGQGFACMQEANGRRVASRKYGCLCDAIQA